MRKSARISALIVGMLPLLAGGLSGCRHKAPPPPPPASTAPPLQPSSITQVAPVPPLPGPATPQVGAPGSDKKADVTAPPPTRHPRRSKKHPAVVADAAVTPPAAPVATAAASVTPPTPAPSLGQLSAGAGADTHERAAMSEQIRTQEARLSKLKHPLNDEDEAITQQIRVFLSKARQAVSESDLDGAQTLTTKAKVLLDELTRS